MRLWKPRNRAYRLLLLEIREMSQAVDALAAAVAANTEAVNAAVAKIGTIGANDSAINAATAAVEANTKALNDAVNPPAPQA